MNQLRDAPWLVGACCPFGNRLKKGNLIDFMEVASSMPVDLATAFAGDDQEGARFMVRLGDGGDGVGGAWPGADDEDSGPLGHPGIAIGHEPGSLLMLADDRLERRVASRGIKQIENGGRDQAEEGIDTVAF